MKIGILTFQRAISYGAALQATALRHVLAQYGHEVSFLDHRCRAIDSDNALFDFSRLSDIKYTVAHLINLPVAAKRSRIFSRFRKAYMPFSMDAPQQMDMVVAGSDQVWNYMLTGNDWYYFLDFPKNNIKKVAYAASFGISEIAKQYHQPLHDLLNDFDFLSVREEQAKSLVKAVANRESKVVLDPTLLLNQEQWCAFTQPRSEDNRYIFVYTVFQDDVLWDFAERLSKKTGLPIKTVSYSVLRRRNADYDYTAGPAEWLNYLMQAQYVITNSFHGVAFAINFQKNFYFNLPKAAESVGSRLYNITSRYGFKDRNICNDPDETIDYTVCLKKLEEDRLASRQFIESFLQTEVKSFE